MHVKPHACLAEKACCKGETQILGKLSSTVQTQFSNLVHHLYVILHKVQHTLESSATLNYTNFDNRWIRRRSGHS